MLSATQGPFSAGFRPFFLVAAVLAGFVMPLWIMALTLGVGINDASFDPAWHRNLFLFGYGSAVLSGFLFTAVPSWTNRPKASPHVLAALIVIWLVGQVGMLLQVPPLAWFGPIYSAVLAVLIAREIFAADSARNKPIVLMLVLFAVAHFGMLFGGDELSEASWRLGLGVLVMLMALIGGRVTPAFTKNWLIGQNQGSGSLPAEFGQFDKITLAVTAGSLVLYAGLPEWQMTGVALMAAGLVGAARLSRWRGLATIREPLVLILHVSYGWICVGLVLLGLSIVFPDVVGASYAVHGLSVGAFGSYTLAFMTRATLGHSGRVLTASKATSICYLLISLSAISRISIDFWPDPTLAHLVAGILFALAYVVYLADYLPLLLDVKSAPS